MAGRTRSARSVRVASFVERRAVLLLAGAVGLVLVAFGSRYGYHRDELYFLAASRHLAWGYPDQGPLTPAVAAAMDAIAPGSLVALRVPSALAAATTVAVTGLLARELRGSKRAQLIAASCAGVAVIVLQTGHLLSTATFDLLAWTVATWLAVRAVVTDNERLWLLVGLVFGVGLLNKPLIAILGAGLLMGVAINGPRRVLLNPWLWAGGLVALSLGAPWLAWQAAHGWPQLEISGSIAAGGSASSQPRWAFLPFQLLLVSPLLAPVWLVGLARLLRAPELRPVRFLGWAWVGLAAIFILTGGKPYYLAGLLPALIAAGAVSVDRWLERGRRSLRRRLLIGAVAVSAVVDGTIALPLLPVERVAPVVAVNPDVGETIGWPELAATVARIRNRGSGEKPVVLTRNYGEAGAIDRFGLPLGLPKAYSGHNAYSAWGPPPENAAPVILVGAFDRERLASFAGCELAARVTSPSGVDNEERGAPIRRCQRPLRPWRELWPRLRRLG